MCVNNLPKIVTRQCPGAESNLRPWMLDYGNQFQIIENSIKNWTKKLTPFNDSKPTQAQLRLQRQIGVATYQIVAPCS